MKNIEYENIHAHSYLSNAYISFPDSPSSIEDYAKAYREKGMQCLILSEHGYRSNVWEQADVAKKYSTEDRVMKPVCAAEVYFVPDNNPELKDGKNLHMLLLAINNDGFEELNYILSEAWVNGFYKHGRVDFNLLEQINPKNFICTTACAFGILSDKDYEQIALRLHNIFDKNFYLEIQHHLNDIQINHNKKVLELYEKYKWPLIYATDSHYINKEDKILRKELQLSKRIEMMDDGDWDLYVPNAEEAFEMLVKQNVFSKARIEEAFENTLRLRECEGFSYDSSRKFPISRPELNQEQRAKLYTSLVGNGYVDKFGMPTKEELEELKSEMKMVVKTGSYDYFIGLHDLMKEGEKNGGVLTKTSRGSAASFATSAALGFTSLNRLHEPVKLYPERFVSEAKLANAMPD